MYKQLVLLLVVVAADQWTKSWIQSTSFEPFVVIDGWFNIIRAHNTGVAFSMFADMDLDFQRWILTGLTTLIAGVVCFWWWKERFEASMTSWALVGVLAGAVGNIWDRIQLGYVVDFLDVYIRTGGNEHHWPTFNVADSSICISVAFLMLSSFKKDQG